MRDLGHQRLQLLDDLKIKLHHQLEEWNQTFLLLQLYLVVVIIHRLLPKRKRKRRDSDPPR
jgi:uncharacterized BrkB/YihY/UPF0761 family membrane protein